MGQCTILKNELFSAKTHNGATNQLFLAMLREKGAPISGCFLLKYDPDYHFTSMTDTISGDVTVRWTPRQVADGAA